MCSFLSRHLYILLTVALLVSAEGLSYAAKNEPKDPFQKALLQLESKNPQVRRQGAAILARMRNPAAADSLIKLLSDDVPAVRSSAIDALGLMRIRAASKKIANILETDKDPSVRQISAVSLGYIADRNTVPSLIKGLEDPHQGTQFACVNSLGILRDSSAVKALSKGLMSKDSRMRNSCAYALGNIADRQAIPAMLEVLKLSRSTANAKGKEYMLAPSVGATLIRSLGIIGDRTFVPKIKPYLKDKNSKVRVYAARALHRLGNNSGLAVVRKDLNDPDSSIRRICVELISKIGTLRDVKALKRMKNDPDSSVRNLAVETAKTISKKYKPKSKPKVKSPKK